MIHLHPESPTPLVSQIVDGFRRLIAEQSLRPGAKLPSIRALAAAHAVSVFTVVEAYDRLVAQGWVVSKSNAGFFVKQRAGAALPGEAPQRDLRFDARWYLRQIFESRNLGLKPAAAGCPTTGCSKTACGAACATWRATAAELGGYGLARTATWPCAC